MRKLGQINWSDYMRSLYNQACHMLTLIKSIKSISHRAPSISRKPKIYQKQSVHSQWRERKDLNSLPIKSAGISCYKIGNGRRFRISRPFSKHEQNYAERTRLTSLRLIICLARPMLHLRMWWLASRNFAKHQKF